MKTGEIRFSVIIPVYNCEEYLKKCLDSFINQGYQNVQIILIDDGSTDSSGIICDEYGKAQKDVYVLHQENAGPGAARNQGIKIADGDYLLFADADDWVAEAYFKTIEAALQNDPVDILMFGRQGSHEGIMKSKEARLSSRFEIINYYSQNYYSADFSSCWNKAYKNKMINNLRFEEGTVVEEDLLFNLHAFDLANSMRVIDAVLYHYNQRESGSVTTTYNPIKMECKLRAYETEMTFANKWNDDRVRELFAANYLSYLSACINNLLYNSCPLSYREKIRKIEEYFAYNSTIESVNMEFDASFRVRIMRFFVKNKLYKSCYLFHKIVFDIKGRNR